MNKPPLTTNYGRALARLFRLESSGGPKALNVIGEQPVRVAWLGRVIVFDDVLQQGERNSFPAVTGNVRLHAVPRISGCLGPGNLTLPGIDVMRGALAEATAL